jgi:RecJ-like exonuclease
MATSSEPPLSPGDEAKPGTPGAGEDLCEACAGSGKLSDGRPCPQCGGTGRVMRGIGGG